MEIGSIFEMDVLDLFRSGDKEFYLPFMEGKSYKYHKFFNTGRSAIEFLLSQLVFMYNQKKILLPAFTCTSIIDAVRRVGLECDFYAITNDFKIDISNIDKKLSAETKFLYIIQYFGSYQSKETYDFIENLRSRGLIVIEDISHALYTRHSEYIGYGDFVLGSIRKWLPIPDGAFLSSYQGLSEQSIGDGYNEYSFKYMTAQIMKKAYLETDAVDKQEFLRIVEQAMDSLFSDYAIRGMTDISLNYLRTYDMTEVVQKRIKNYDYLINGTVDLPYIRPVFPRKSGQVPLGFTVLSEERDRLLSYLIENNIYCNVHWRIPDECKEADPISHQLSKNILTIPCDQRYGLSEMDYIIRMLKGFGIS